MSYFKIGDIDFSMYVNKLTITKEANYNALVNAAGNTVVDYINKKRVIEVGIIPLDNAAMANLLTAIDAFSLSISFLNPETGALETIACIIPNSNVDYYTIQAGNTSFKAFTLEFIEL